MRALLMAVALAVPSAALAQKEGPADKAIGEAVAALEKALAATKDAAEVGKLNAAIEALKKVAVAGKVQNELISDFVDKPAKYKGQILTFKLTYSDRPGLTPLNKRVGRDNVPFLGRDSKNKAELLLGLSIPAGLEVPAAKHEEAVIVTFKCVTGETTKGNVAVEIRRP